MADLVHSDHDVTNEPGENSTVCPQDQNVCQSAAEAWSLSVLSLLPEELLRQEILGRVQLGARAACRTFRDMLDSGRLALKLKLSYNFRPASQGEQISTLLARMPNLRGLQCDIPKLHDGVSAAPVEALVFRDGLTALTLRLAYAHDTDIPTVPLQRCSTIVRLELRNCRLPDGSFAQLMLDNRLTLLTLQDCSITSLPHDLTQCSALTHLDLSTSYLSDHPNELRCLAPLTSCPQLQFLDVTTCQCRDSDTYLLSLSPLSCCHQLTSLNLRGHSRPVDVGALASCRLLRSLFFRNTKTLVDLSFLHPRGSPLEVLAASCAGLEDVSPLLRCDDLVKLNLDFTDVSNLMPIQACLCLTHVSFVNCKHLKDITPLGHLHALLKVDLAGSAVADFSALSLCKQLTDIDASLCPLADVQPFAACPQLTRLNIVACQNIKDYQPLAACAALKWLYFSANKLGAVPPMPPSCHVMPINA